MIKGEIWWAKLPSPIASEPGYKRHVLIIQANAFNKSNIQTIICAIITKNIKLANAPGNILLNKYDSNLKQKSVINISQIITIDKSFLTKCVGSVSKKILDKVDLGIKLIFEIK